MQVRVLIHVYINVGMHPAAGTDNDICCEKIEMSGTRAGSEKACAPHQASYRLYDELICCSEEQ